MLQIFLKSTAFVASAYAIHWLLRCLNILNRPVILFKLLLLFLQSLLPFLLEHFHLLFCLFCQQFLVNALVNGYECSLDNYSDSVPSIPLLELSNDCFVCFEAFVN